MNQRRTMSRPHIPEGGDTGESIFARWVSWAFGAFLSCLLYLLSCITESEYDVRLKQEVFCFDDLDPSWLASLCPPCQSIFWYPPNIWHRIPAYHKSDDSPNPGQRHWNSHHANIQEIRECGQNAESPCKLCYLVSAAVSIIRILRPLLDPTVEGHPEYEKREVRVAIEHRLRINLEDGFLGLDFDFADSLPPLRLIIIPLQSNEPLFVKSLGEETSTEATFELAKRWLRHCLDNHSECASAHHYDDDDTFDEEDEEDVDDEEDEEDADDDDDASPSWLPTRLIEVCPKTSPTVRLVLSKELTSSPSSNTTPPARYAALSHCWGGVDDILKLESENISKLLQPSGINIEHDLPKTFQDAVTICRRLDIPYLWIDSLCIIQDSKSDWANECSLMGDVYSKATVTIAATASETCHSGIFFPRLGYKSRMEFHIPGNPLVWHEAYSLSCKTLAVVPLNWESFWRANLDNFSPLNNRGWTFQERLLSRRILHFGRLGIAWECDTSCASEFAHEGYPVDDDLYVRGGPGRPKKPTCPLPRRATDLRELNKVQSWEAWSRSFKAWTRFVEAYSQRSLTFASDRLVAISAVAREMRLPLGGIDDQPYYAGLWRPNLLAQLCWKVDWSRVSTVPSSTSSQQEEEKGPPSWSWASTSHPVIFPILPSREYLLRKRFMRFLARLVDIETTPLPEFSRDPFGQVSGGFLTLKGRLIPVRVVEAERGDPGRPKETRWRLADPETRLSIQPPIWVSFNKEGYSSRSSDSCYYILPIMHRVYKCDNGVDMRFGWSAKGPVDGLLLEMVDEATKERTSVPEEMKDSGSFSSSYYRRVGSFFSQDVYVEDSWFGFLQGKTDAYDAYEEAMGQEEGTSIKII